MLFGLQEGDWSFVRKKNYGYSPVCSTDNIIKNYLIDSLIIFPKNLLNTSIFPHWVNTQKKIINCIIGLKVMRVYRYLLAKGKRGIFQPGGSVTDWTSPSSCELRSIETGVSCSGAITLTYTFCFKLFHLNCIKLDRVAPLVTDSPSAKSTLFQNPFLFQPSS